MHHPTDRIAHTTAFVTPVVEHWLEREILRLEHISNLSDLISNSVFCSVSISSPGAMLLVFQVEHIGCLKTFLESLTSLVHEEIPHSQVLWYDSVTNTGELKWQDMLNEKNRWVAQWSSTEVDCSASVYETYGW